MTPIVVSDVLAVGEFPTLEQLEILAKAGFRSVINNQADGEVERFPASAKVAAEAKRLGLAHAYAPIASRTPDGEQLAAMARAIETLPAPIYAFCYSGSRSAAAAAHLLTATLDADAVVAEFARGGIDIASLKPWLEDERKRRGTAKPATANGHATNGAAGNGHAAAEPAKAAPVAPVPAQPVPAGKAVQGIVVHARAAGFGGFAM